MLAQKATAQRLAKQKFKQMMSYIMKRRERCASHWFIWIHASDLHYLSCWIVSSIIYYKCCVLCRGF